MSKKRELDQLVGEAVKQGLQFSYQPSGHWQAYNPDPDWTGERKVKISSTPRSDRGVTDARVKLTRIGYRPKRPPKRKRVWQNKIDPERYLPPLPQTEISEKETEEMARIGEIAELKTVLDTDQVRGDIPVAAYILWQVIRAKMSDSPGSKRTMGDREGHIWSGQRTKVTQELWPDIARGDDTRITTYLRGSKNMLCLTRGTGGSNSIWWVADEFDGDYTEASARKTPLEWWREEDEVTDTGHDRVTTEDLQVRVEQAAYPEVIDLTDEPMVEDLVAVRLEDERPKRVRPGKHEYLTPDEDGFYRCAQCAFASKNKMSLVSHLSKLKDGEHPNDVTVPCKYCPDIFPSGKQLTRHQSRIHFKDTGEWYCPTCLEYYTQHPYQHKWTDEHTTALKANRDEMVSPVSEMLSVEAVEAEIVAEAEELTPHRVLFPEITDAEMAVRQILIEINALRTKNAELTLVNSQHEERMEVLEARNAELLTQITAMKSKMVDAFKEFLNQ